ncbi:MAG TPA: DUF6220 domain-containing protein [Candidatus Dormibacteraeota bacterium]|nr:DUF6220 domain-containing protein [Candidatus Dormibacteraeota bacterium]
MVRNLRWVYAGWFVLITAAVVLQLYLAGYGVFAFNGLNGFGAHFVVGDLIGIAILIGIGLAFAARVPWNATAINGALVVLMVIQFLLAHTGVAVISALHILNGVLILALTGFLTRRLVTLARGGAPALVK